MKYKQLTTSQIDTINTIYMSNKIIRDCERRMGGDQMSVYEYDETMENVHRHPDTEDDEYMFDEYIDMLIDRARGQD